jgi:alpha-galactosidase
MWGGLGRPFYVNTANRGAVTNLPDDAFLELRSDVDMSGPRPQAFGEMPRGVLGLTQQVLDAHELTAEAAATFDRGLVLRALATDPIVSNLGDARRIMDELFEREREALDGRWFESP